MKDFQLPGRFSDKIYEIRTDGKETISKMISYFPFSDSEKKEIRDLLGDKFSSGIFRSIFSDVISDEEWEKSKVQIKKRFQEELFEIDKA